MRSLGAACSSTSGTDAPAQSEVPGAGTPTDDVPVLLESIDPADPGPTTTEVSTRPTSYGLGIVMLADGVAVPLRGVAAWPDSATGDAPVRLVMVLRGSEPCRRLESPRLDAGALQIVSPGVD
jgi:hypothetical protein